MTLLEVAEECTKRGAPISEAQISRIERGAVPRPALRAVLAEFFGLNSDLSEPESRRSA